MKKEKFIFSKKIKQGFYSANYFLKTMKIIKNELPNHIVTMQFFQRKNNVMLCGINEIIALIFKFAKQPKKLIIETLNDGDIIKANEPVLKITGKYENFGFLESIIDGILSRRSSIATNVYRIKKILTNKYDIISMSDRQDDYINQIGDGYAMHVAGINKVSTDAHGSFWGAKGIGTMPHALIQMCNGNLIKAIELFIKTFPNEKVIALVDYHNNVINDTIEVIEKFKKKISAIRVDTSKSLIDKYFNNKNVNDFDPHGVCKELIIALRNILDKKGFKFVKIIVSSNFTLKKIKKWVKLKVPVDIFGVGGALIVNNTVNFTGDLVTFDGKDEAKFGRKNIISKRLKTLNNKKYIIENDL